RVVADIEVLAVGAENHTLREAAHLDLAHLRHFFVVDLEYGQAAVSLDVEPHALRHARPTQEHGHSDVAPWADRKALGRVPHHHAIDDLRRVVPEPADADGVDVNVRRAGITVARPDGGAPV